MRHERKSFEHHCLWLMKRKVLGCKGTWYIVCCQLVALDGLGEKARHEQWAMSSNMSCKL